MRKPVVAYREHRDRELAHRYTQVLSRKERTHPEIKRQPPPSNAAGMANPNSGPWSSFRQRWSAFHRSLDIKIRIVMYRIAPFFTLREYYLSPWYEKNQRKSKEAMWMMSWQQMNQPVVLQGRNETAISISTYFLSHILSSHHSIHFPFHTCQQPGHVVDRQVKREQQRIRRPEALTADDANNKTGIFKNIQDVYSGIVGLGSLLGFGSLAENTRANVSTRADDDIDDQSFNNSGKSNSSVDEQISLNDDPNSLLRVRSQQGLTRCANLFITTLIFIIV